MNDKTISIIQRVCKKLAPKYTFGYYSIEDIEQEAFMFAMEALSRYDERQSTLQTFLYIHINNRLKTFKRDNYLRKDFVCKYCGRKDPNCEHCKRREWKYMVKKHLMEPIDIDNINSNEEKNAYTYPDLSENLEIQEMLNAINKKLPIALREDFLKDLDGIQISKQKKQIIEAHIITILEEEGFISYDNN